MQTADDHVEGLVAQRLPELTLDAEEGEKTRFPKMGQALSAYRAGAITFDFFARATAQDWTRLARLLYRRWPLPVDVAEEDVRQELLLALVERRASSGFKTLIEKWNPEMRGRNGRQVPLARYVVWNACVWACRWLHARRGASRDNNGVQGKAPGRFLLPVSAYESDDGPEKVATAEARQERHVELVSAIESVVQALRGPRSRAAFQALVSARGNRDEAAEVLLARARSGAVSVDVRTLKQAQGLVDGAVARAQRAVEVRGGAGE